MVLNKEFKEKVIKELNSRIKQVRRETLKCPCCKHNNFQILDGYTRRDLNENLDTIQIGGNNVPSISIICTNCGYIMDFSIGVLGFLNENEGKKDDR